MVISFEGHHGTSLESAKAILHSDFRLSVGDEEWLGDGVYFFVEGISSKTEDLAVKWAIAQSWNNYLKKNTYNQYCVLKSIIEVDEDNFLDLTTEQGLEVFEFIIGEFFDKMGSLRKKLKFFDGMFINYARKEGLFSIEVAKVNSYIRFTRERIHQVYLRTNNCTICAVFDTDKNIRSTEIVKTGDIN